MQSLSFNIQGSAPEPYEVIFYHVDGQLSGSCTCGAGRQSKYCKHRLDFLQGNINNIIEPNYKDVEMVFGWYSNSDIKSKIEEIDNFKSEIDALKAKQKESENELSKLLNR
jgi:hypothetical protein